MSAKDLKVSKLTPTIGAELSGIDLNTDLDSATLNAIYDALIDNLVIFFRDQDLSPEGHLRLARSFGEPQPPHPVYPHVEDFENIMVLANDAKTPPDTDGWHADVTYNANPPFASILCAREVPECGGDTQWASMYAAYDALPGGMKADLADMTAVHDLGDFRNNFATGPNAAEKIVSAHGRFGSAVHPVVMHHPITNRPYLYVNEGFTQHIVGMAARQSRRLITYLLDHINRPEYQVRFRWQNGSIAMWDNRVTQHYAVADYLPAYRCMHRITVVNDARADQRAAMAQAG